MTFAKLETIQDSLAREFAGLTEAVSRLGERLSQLLDIAEDTNTRVRNLEDQIRKVLDQLQLLNREVRPNDSLSVRGERERRLVEHLVSRYRSLPEDQKQQRPDLLNQVGKLGVVVGNFEAAQHDFAAAAQMADDPKARAEGYYNAYRAALEGQKWAVALDAYRQATALDPRRFTLFPAETFQPQRILGAGGFGVVFLCQHVYMGRPVVVKSLAASELNRDLNSMFAEARTLDELHHPGIIRVRDCGYADDARVRPYLVMDYFDGTNLHDHVKAHGSLAPEEFLKIGRQLAGALQAAHAKGVCHRDVKPANLLVRRDDGGSWAVKVIDFGLALQPAALEAKASTQGSKARTVIGKSIAGTIHFAAPEQMGQLPGAPVGPHSDVYGFGKTCYYALTGTPDPDDGEKEVLHDGWKRLLSRCTRRAVENRFPNFAEVLAELANINRPLAVDPRKKEVLEKKEPTKTVTGVKEPRRLEGTCFSFRNRGLEAQGYPIDRGFIVLAGGQAAGDTAPSLPDAIANLRASLLRDGVLIQDGNHLKLTRDYTFSSSSAAVSVLAGASRSGPEYWKDADGTSLRDHGNQADALGKKARDLLAKGKTAKAIEVLTQLVKLEPGVSAPLLERGQAHALAGNHDKAVADFNRAVQLDSARPEAFVARGQFHAAQGNLDLSLADFAAALQRDRNCAEAFYRRGVIRLGRPAPDEAWADFTEALRLKPDDARAVNGLGRVWLLRGRIDEALAEFLRASQLDPHCAEALVNRAEVWARRGQLDQAESDLTHAFQLDPRCAPAIAGRGRVRVRLGKHRLALTDFTRAIKLSPREARLFLDRGRTYRMREDYAAAVKDFNAALKLTRQPTDAHLARGEAYLAWGKFGQALADFDQVLKLSPATPYLSLLRSRALVGKGDPDQALAAVAETLQKHPSLAEAHHIRGRALFGRQALPEALQALTESLRLDGNNAACYNERGLAHQTIGDCDRALADFTAAILLDPKCGEYYLNRSRAYEKKGDREKAREDRARAAALNAAP